MRITRDTNNATTMMTESSVNISIQVRISENLLLCLHHGYNFWATIIIITRIGHNHKPNENNYIHHQPHQREGKCTDSPSHTAQASDYKGRSKQNKWIYTK